MKGKKIKVEVFFSFGVCACSFGPFMERVVRVASGFKDSVEVQMKSISSEEARAYAIDEPCVIVDGSTRLSEEFSERQLEEAIIEKLYAAQLKD